MEQFAVNEFGQPTGLPLHGWWSGRAALPSVPSGGRYCRLERVDAAAHSADLFNAYAEAPDARDWTYLPMERPSGPEAYADARMEGAGRSEDPFFMALLDARSGEALGILGLHASRPRQRLDRDRPFELQRSARSGPRRRRRRSILR